MVDVDTKVFLIVEYEVALLLVWSLEDKMKCGVSKPVIFLLGNGMVVVMACML